MHANPRIHDDLLMLNRIAIGAVSIEQGLQWFRDLPVDGRQSVLASAHMMVVQAKPSPEQVESAIAASGLKPTYTPCMVLRKSAPLVERLRKITELPEDEWSKSLQLLLGFFVVADQQRRASRPDCRSGTCNHWWHKLR
jgi:hypothetical protein